MSLAPNEASAAYHVHACAPRAFPPFPSAKHDHMCVRAVRPPVIDESPSRSTERDRELIDIGDACVLRCLFVMP